LRFALGLEDLMQTSSLLSVSSSPADHAYRDLVTRLSASSVTKHADAYADIDWEHPSYRIEAEDPRFELTPDEPLGATAWYRAQPSSTRASIGLHLAASRMKVGIAFENILARGLLELASVCPRGSIEFRYAHHEVIEESQHSLMFQEFINRAGLDVRGMSAFDTFGARGVPRLGRVFPELFFLHVLAGELPIDHVQRQTLRRGHAAHPLLRRIMQIHVSEEARHVCFASRFLEERVPRLSAWSRARLRMFAPFVLGGTTASMMRLPSEIVAQHAIPREAVSELYASARHAEARIEGLAPVGALCTKLGLITPRTAFLWRWMGLGAIAQAGVAEP
jgi:hypothetical protein